MYVNGRGKILDPLFLFLFFARLRLLKEFLRAMTSSSFECIALLSTTLPQSSVHILNTFLYILLFD